ncbi:VWA domain-containing protein [Actinomadura darangshiensis]|uniref:VWA domain-containing protein n=1 Tax=Actinomadura darangshiensis TaxID=705336 RepID=A0A4R5B4A3_9ACTN|nr:vWA domain-containing protein [Actinomadura darangshiensis]TDD79116.1 VWA domain-containing protein [Actinomadura darangshiensis]
MTGPHGGDGDRSRPPQRQDGLPDWLRRLLQVMLLDLCSTVIVSIGVTLVHGVFWLNAVISLLVIALVTGGLFAFYPDAAHAVLERVSRPLKWGGAALAWCFAGAAVMALVLLAGTGAYRLRENASACGQPLELRVLTAPETLTPLRAAAAEFANDSEDRGCRKYSVTVVPEAGPVPLYDGFRLLWRRSEPADQGHADAQQLFGPQPDIWIPSSKAEYDFIPKGSPQTGARGMAAGAAGKADPYFRPRGSLGSSPLVLALFTKAHESVADPIAAPIAPNTAGLLKRIADAGVKLRAVARPVPETSAAALAVTPALYNATPSGDNRGDERFAEPADLVAPDAVSLLCRFRQQAAAQQSEPPDDIAVAVPEQVLHDYDMGRPLGDRCGAVDAGSAPYAKWRLHPYYATDLPTLDYPFVQVRWRGQDTRERDAAVSEFHRWLERNPLTSQGLRDDRGVIPAVHEGDTSHFYLSRLQEVVGNRVMPGVVGLTPAAGVQETLDLIGAARPRVSVSLLLDVSGSMGGAAQARGGSRLVRGTSFLRSLVSQLQSNDRVGLQVSSQAAAPNNPETFGNVPQDAASPDQKNAVASRLQAVASSGADQPLSDAIAAADLGSGRQNLILVTDGQLPATNPRIDSRAEFLSGEFRKRHPGLRLTVVLTGPATCGSSPVRQIVAALGPKGGKGCVPLTEAPEVEQAAELLSGLR